MGLRGGAAPSPYTTRHAQTRFLRVPIMDWPAVKIGRKTEFRKACRVDPKYDYTPTPVVAYSKRGTTYDHTLMVLESVRKSMLWEVHEDAEGLSREGFDSYPEFRTYWRTRHFGKYDPAMDVYVFRIRPAALADLTEAGLAVVAHLYGEYA